MNSPNILHHPLNRKGCLELGLSPCLVCSSGFANYSANEKISSCYDTCEAFKIYCDKEEMEQIKLKECDHV